MNNNEFEYSEKTKRRVRIFKRILSFIVLILAIATMVALFYVKKEKMKKVLPASRNIKITDELLGRLYQIFGEKNVKAVEKYIENTGKMH